MGVPPRPTCEHAAMGQVHGPQSSPCPVELRSASDSPGDSWAPPTRHNLSLGNIIYVRRRWEMSPETCVLFMSLWVQVTDHEGSAQALRTPLLGPHRAF